MNTYNENLHASIVNSLQSQQLTQKQLASKLNASMFTLYYAEGAVITAADKRDISAGVLTKKQAVMVQAVNDSNLCTNLVGSATQANSYLKQMVTNSAVSAASVQVASNAIVRLASDAASIFSILNAADYGTNIFNCANEAQTCMNATASEAEAASKTAMEASRHAAVVSGSTVHDKAKSTNITMGSVLKIASAEFNNISQIVANDNATLAAANVKEKAAEGDYEDISADYNASTSAYNLTNTELNINLEVVVLPPPAIVTDQELRVTFHTINTPFPTDGTPKYPYPVINYNIIVVKDQNKYTFSASTAEAILEIPGQFVCITMPPDNPPTNLTAAINTTVYENVSIAKKTITCDFKYTDLLDADGDAIAPGDNYVAFIVAVYSQDYKKKLNVFDDYLSAPSPTFIIANPLPQVTSVSGTGNNVKYVLASGAATLRLMFLPFPQNVSGMMTEPVYTQLENIIASEVTVEKKPSAKKTSAQEQSAADAGNTAGSTAPALAPLPFFFNITLAQHVPAANYIPVNQASTPDANGINIPAGTTDNFGNVLNSGDAYLPVMLNMPVTEDDTTVIPSMSALNSSYVFTYQAQ